LYNYLFPANVPLFLKIRQSQRSNFARLSEGKFRLQVFETGKTGAYEILIEYEEQLIPPIKVIDIDMFKGILWNNK